MDIKNLKAYDLKDIQLTETEIEEYVESRMPKFIAAKQKELGFANLLNPWNDIFQNQYMTFDYIANHIHETKHAITILRNNTKISLSKEQWDALEVSHKLYFSK